LSDSELSSANDRIAAIYKPSNSQPPKDINTDNTINLSRLIPGVVRDDSLDDGTLLGFGDDLSSPLGFQNSNQLGYVYSGGGFIDAETTHAPEELAPGTTYENLSISVFTKWSTELLLSYDADNTSSYSGNDTISDISGNNNSAEIVGYVPSVVPKSSGINVIRFPANVNTKVDFSVTELFGNPEMKTITIEMWAMVDSFAGGMFFGWHTYDVWTSNGHLGFNTGNGDIYGISSNRIRELYLAKRWVQYVFIMNTEDYTLNKIFINGVEEELAQQLSSQNKTNTHFNNGDGRIGGWRRNDSYQQVMDVGIFRIYGRNLTPKEIATLFNEKSFMFWIAKPANSIDISQTWPDIYSPGKLTDVLPNQSVTLAYRLTKDNLGNTNYHAISRRRETSLKKELKWDDRVIYVDNATVLSTPDIDNRVPGTIYIGGEKINYYQIDTVMNTISQLLRGVDRTSTPIIHNSDTIVSDAGVRMTIPSSTVSNFDTIVFSNTIKTITTTFNVPNNLDQILAKLTLKIGMNILELGKYYTVGIKRVENGSYKAIITFTKFANTTIADKTEISLTFEQEYVWVDSIDLIESNTSQAKFLKKILY
jgi:hypothetical protein